MPSPLRDFDRASGAMPLLAEAIASLRGYVEAGRRGDRDADIGFSGHVDMQSHNGPPTIQRAELSLRSAIDEIGSKTRGVHPAIQDFQLAADQLFISLSNLINGPLAKIKPIRVPARQVGSTLDASVRALSKAGHALVDRRDEILESTPHPRLPDFINRVEEFTASIDRGLEAAQDRT